MTVLVWDAPGEHTFQSGVDRGVLYVPDSVGVVWNGLTGVEEAASSELKSYYLNGIKYLEYLAPGDFVGTLRAITYPDEFDALNGIAEIAPGLFYYNQLRKSFGLSYRTLLGDDLVGPERGYKIHLLYNVLANSDNSSFATHNPEISPIEFSWGLSGTPPILSGSRPTSHIVVDSIRADSEALASLEALLYGSGESDPSLPTIAEVTALFAP